MKYLRKNVHKENKNMRRFLDIISGEIDSNDNKLKSCILGNAESINKF
jgi:hypothetical protein